jgi:amidase
VRLCHVAALSNSPTPLPQTSGYTGVYANGDGEKGVAECPFDFYRTWITNPLEAQRMAETVTRRTIGVSCCPVAGIPAPNEIADIEELTHELNLE